MEQFIFILAIINVRGLSEDGLDDVCELFLQMTLS